MYKVKISMIWTKKTLNSIRYLVGKGVDAGRLESEGYGETQTIEPGCADMKNRKARSECRAKNRRVSFTILDPPAESK